MTIWHSKWLSFIEKRLRLAKRLLSPQGVICVTIDDNEACRLGLLLDEIYSNKERQTVVIRSKPSGVAKHGFYRQHEYAFFLLNKGQKIFKHSAPSDIRNTNLRRSGDSSLRTDIPNMFYPILVNKKTMTITGAGDIPPYDFHPCSQTVDKGTYWEVYPIDDNNIEKRWYFGKERVDKQGAQELTAKWIKERIQIRHVTDNKQQKRYGTIWVDKKYSGEHGKKLLQDVLPGTLGRSFPYPKSLFAVEDCISSIAKNNKNLVILDFFAGSGTTGHSVLKMNKRDGGNRQFILCTNNENQIAEQITYPRLKRVIEGYDFRGSNKHILKEYKFNLQFLKKSQDVLNEITEIELAHGTEYDKLEKKFDDNKLVITGIKNVQDKQEGTGGNLRYFKMNFISRYPDNTDLMRKKLMDVSTDMICIKESTFTATVTQEDHRVFSNDEHYCVIIFNTDSILEIIQYFNQLNDNLALHIYIFSFNSDNYSSDFRGLKRKTEIIPVPESILEVYQRIFRNKKGKNEI